MTGRPQTSLAERFWEKVVKSEGCWEWSGARSKHGRYGIINVGGRSTKAHRVSWELNRGPIPPGAKVLHHCDNPPCVRPDHLFIGTQADNLADGRRKGRIRNVVAPAWSHCPDGCTCHRHEPRRRYWSAGRPCPEGCACGRHKRAVG